VATARRRPRRPRLIPLALAEARMDMLRCKALRGHAWEAIASDADYGPDIPLSLRCVVCGTIRIDLLDRRTGDLLSRRYDYPDGYRELNTSGVNQRLMRLAFALRTNGTVRGFEQPAPHSVA